MWTVRYTVKYAPDVFEVYCQDESQLLALVEVLERFLDVREFKVGRFLIQCKDGDFKFAGYSKWVMKFSHEKGVE